jgi:predicted DNA-binding protein YlxM (UPF0122 family)
MCAREETPVKGKNLDIAMLLDFYGEMLTQKQREVIDLYYNEDLSLAEIAEHAQITRQGVRDSIKRGEAQLFEMEEKLGLAKRFSEMKEGVGAITTLTKELEEVNASTLRSREMSEKIKQILEEAQKLAQ